MATMTIIDENAVSVQKLLITAEDYQKMGKAGIFENKPKCQKIKRRQSYDYRPFII